MEKPKEYIDRRQSFDKPSRSSFATGPVLKPLDRTGPIFKFRAGTLVHAFPAEIDKGHKIKTFVRCTGHELCRGKIGLGNHGNQSLPGPVLRRQKQVAPAESSHARSQNC